MTKNQRNSTLTYDPENPLTPSQMNRRQLYISISDEAWEYYQTLVRTHKYTGTAIYQGTSSLIRALLKANPTPEHYTDTRPDHMRAADAQRLLYRLPNGTPAPKLPLWFEDDVREVRPRSIRTDVVLYHAAQCLAIADRFYIRSRTSSTAVSFVSVVLEAIGLTHLTPANPPTDCPLPANPKNRRRRNYNRWELAF